jgi:hypothetical protein
MEYLLIVVAMSTVLALGAAYGSLAATMYVMQRTVRSSARVPQPTSHQSDRQAA